MCRLIFYTDNIISFLWILETIIIDYIRYIGNGEASVMAYSYLLVVNFVFGLSLHLIKNTVPIKNTCHREMVSLIYADYV